MTTTNFFPLFYSKLAGVKVRISHSHLATPNICFSERIYLFLTRLFSQIKFACGQDAGEFLFGKKSKFIILNNAINLDKFVYNEKIRLQKRKEFGFNDENIVIGHVGRFVEQKNHKFLVDIFDKCFKNDNRYRLLLIGNGELEDNIKAYVRKLGLDKNIMFLGVRNDVNEILNAMDIFALPSLFEGFPVVGIEAQANGLKTLLSSNIDKRIKVTNNAFIIDLDEQKWCQEIFEFCQFDRKNVLNQLTNKGYNIKIEAEKLDSFYKKQI